MCLRRKDGVRADPACPYQPAEIILNLMIQGNRTVGVDGSDVKFGDVSDCMVSHEPSLKCPYISNNIA
jgi:predicted metal-binding protein